MHSHTHSVSGQADTVVVLHVVGVVDVTVSVVDVTVSVVDGGPTGKQTVPVLGDGFGTSNPMQALYDISSSFLHQR